MPPRISAPAVRSTPVDALPIAGMSRALQLGCRFFSRGSVGFLMSRRGFRIGSGDVCRHHALLGGHGGLRAAAYHVPADRALAAADDDGPLAAVSRRPGTLRADR